MVPVVLLPPVTPFTCQVTAVFEVPVTVAVNWVWAPSATVTVEGDTETVIVGPPPPLLLLPPPQPIIRNSPAESRTAPPRRKKSAIEVLRNFIAQPPV